MLRERKLEALRGEGYLVTESQSRNEVRELTHLLRQSDDDYWRSLRAVLAQKGIDVERSWLADVWPEDYRFELGYVVASDGEVYRFGFDWTQGRDKGVLREWVRLQNEEELIADNEWAIAEEGISAARELAEESQG